MCHFYRHRNNYFVGGMHYRGHTDTIDLKQPETVYNN